MKPRRIWLTAAVLIALIWAGVALVMQQTDDLVSWPIKVSDLAENAPWLHGMEGTHESRQQHLDKVITNLNRLDPGQRKTLREDAQPVLDAFFASLTEEEQKEYVDRTVEPYFATISKGLKLMPAEERKRLTARIRNDMKGLRGSSKDGDRLSEQDREFMDMLVAEDPILFLREAPTKTKMELAPVIEEMQARVQGMRR